jgi:hypothetical protein
VLLFLEHEGHEEHYELQFNNNKYQQPQKSLHWYLSKKE